MTRLLARHQIHYGWAVVGCTFLTMLATAAAMGAPGIMLEPLQREFGWSNADISAAMAIRLAVFGLMAPFAAAFMNRFGIRRVVFAAIAMIVAGIAGSLFMTELWHLVALWGIVIGFGTGMTALVLGATVAARWFSERRGLVIGLLTASNATGQLVFLPILASLSERFGWRPALVLVVTVLLLALALVGFVMRDRPSDVGLPPYGEAAVLPEPPQVHGMKELLRTPLLVLAEAARSHTFWVLFLTFFICGFSTNGLIQTHWITLCGDFGITPVGAAGALAVIGLFDLVGTIGSGWLSDRFDNRRLLFWYYGLRGLSLLYLPFSDFSFYSLGLFAVFYGLDWVATVPPTVRLVAERFGREKAGMVFGWVFTAHQLGAASAAMGAGVSRTEFASYMPAITIAGTLCLLAALLILSVSRPSEAEPKVPATA
ncbi:MFS transporter [Aureimonas sp. AU40]|uniref:MFS transporter n=1 Tax=Aureimonas sp. AU40 TaxID=1637747 RepID=UPI00078128F1|nr:MFS transporter [Aureimonas sp. AU40]